MKYPKKKTSKYRSGLELSVIQNLERRKVNYMYESVRIAYSKPATNHIYTPDLDLLNGIFVEIKGFFKREDRQKHLHIKKSNPRMDIRFIFGNSKNKIYKGSKTSYADWCTKNGFMYADRIIPEEWIKDKQ